MTESLSVEERLARLEAKDVEHDRLLAAIDKKTDALERIETAVSSPRVQKALWTAWGILWTAVTVWLAKKGIVVQQ